MRDGICPKCAAAQVYEVMLRGRNRRMVIGVLTWMVRTLYVCKACGYSETYFLDSIDRDKLPAYGRRVPPAK